jgi:hypothetical protein
MKESIKACITESGIAMAAFTIHFVIEAFGACRTIALFAGSKIKGVAKIVALGTTASILQSVRAINASGMVANQPVVMLIARFAPLEVVAFLIRYSSIGGQACTMTAAKVLVELKALVERRFHDDVADGLSIEEGTNIASKNFMFQLQNCQNYDATAVMSTTGSRSRHIILSSRHSRHS